MSTYSSLILAETSLIAYYRLNEAMGKLAHDQSANKYHGTINNNNGQLVGVTLQQQNAIISDPLDYAMLFNGTNGYITLPSGLKTDGLSALSVEFWVNRSSNSSSFMFVLSNDNNPTSSHLGFRVILSLPSDASIGYFEMGNGTIGASRRIGSSNLSVFYGNVVIGSWYHIVCVYDGTQLLAYVNGILDQNSNPALTGTIGTATHPLYIGASPSLASNFPGLIDEVAIYNAALSASDVLAHYQAGTYGQSGMALFPSTSRRQS